MAWRMTPASVQVHWGLVKAQLPGAGSGRQCRP